MIDPDIWGWRRTEHELRFGVVKCLSLPRKIVHANICELIQCLGISFLESSKDQGFATFLVNSQELRELAQIGPLFGSFCQWQWEEHISQASPAAKTLTPLTRAGLGYLKMDQDISRPQTNWELKKNHTLLLSRFFMFEPCSLRFDIYVFLF